MKPRTVSIAFAAAGIGLLILITATTASCHPHGRQNRFREVAREAARKTSVQTGADHLVEFLEELAYGERKIMDEFKVRQIVITPLGREARITILGVDSAGKLALVEWLDDHGGKQSDWYRLDEITAKR